MVAKLKELAQDKSRRASDIATLLSVEFERDFSRNAVLGQANRHGIRIGAGRETRRQKQAAAKQKRAAAGARLPRRMRPPAPPNRTMAPKPPSGHVAGDPWPDDRVHWPGLSGPPAGRRCQWPIGEVGAKGFGYCGRNVAAQAGGTGPLARTYCQAHARRALRARKAVEAVEE